MHLKILGLGTKKAKQRSPAFEWPPGPHGHPDVVPPICNRNPKGQRPKGAMVAENKNPAFFHQLGTGKGNGQPLKIREI